MYPCERFPVESPEDRLLGCGGGQALTSFTILFQTFRRLLYHWHDVRSARGDSAQIWQPWRLAFLDFCRLEKGLSANSLGRLLR